MKVLIGCLFFREYTGSELYVYELAKNLRKKKCSVTIVSADISPEMEFRATNVGVEVIKPPQLKGREFDIIHCQHQPVIEMLLKVYPNTPKICTIHSEILKYEEPIFDKSILLYIAIRQSIYDYLLFRGLDKRKVKLIFNPIDHERFNTLNSNENNHLLFVGNNDYLRKKTIKDLIDYTFKEGLTLKLVGDYKSADLVDFSKVKHLEVFTPIWNVESFVKDCRYTASVMMGRTIIEGWMCGKSGWQYLVDGNGNILNKELIAPPSAKELNMFYSNYVTEQIYQILKTKYENPI